ncbi:sugar ABC transporter permease [Rhizobium sp. KVB221]|uniref:Sugar ABC transporter permease n=1 Tax=Rhizobium setariae TaxID=2801340 RepID=A0A936YSG1_9HYPH|nr:sugar ABC transporter permease [Rhizobium setariae]MBL0371565.1 sugar ABC transporter permease [Rhizobium setariae]
MRKPRETDQALLARIDFARVAARERAGQRRNFRTAFLFMAPAIILVCGILLAPVAYNLWLSTTNWKKFKGLDEFIGLANYGKMATNPYFTEALINTGIWVLASILFPITIGLALAMFFRGIRLEGAFKTIIFIPRILAPTAVGVLWLLVYSPNGMFNTILSFLAGYKIDVGWLYEQATVTPATVVTFVWQTVGLVMVLMLLGLNAIPKDPLEAAHIDGASKLQVFTHIVLPMLLPTLLMVTILSVLAGFTVFDLLWVMGVSYPGQRSLSLAVFMYFEAFQKGNWAFGSAIAVVIGLVVLCVTWFQAWLQHRVDRMMK